MEKNEKWYSSIFGAYAGMGVAIALVATGIGGCQYLCNKDQGQPIVQKADINGNGIQDKFYNIDGKIAIVELDGKPVTKSLDTKLK